MFHAHRNFIENIHTFKDVSKITRRYVGDFKNLTIGLYWQYRWLYNIKKKNSWRSCCWFQQICAMIQIKNVIIYYNFKGIYFSLKNSKQNAYHIFLIFQGRNLLFLLKQKLMLTIRFEILSFSYKNAFAGQIYLIHPTHFRLISRLGLYIRILHYSSWNFLYENKK